MSSAESPKESHGSLNRSSGVFLLNDGAKIRLFSDTTKFRVAIRRDFQQPLIPNFVNKANSQFCVLRNIVFCAKKHSFVRENKHRLITITITVLFSEGRKMCKEILYIIYKYIIYNFNSYFFSTRGDGAEFKTVIVIVINCSIWVLFQGGKKLFIFFRNYFVVSKIIIIFAPTKMKHLFFVVYAREMDAPRVAKHKITTKLLTVTTQHPYGHE